MISDVRLAGDILGTESRYLSNIKLFAENEQFLREIRNRRYKMRSLQFPQHHTRRMSGEMKMDDELKIKMLEEIKYHQEEMHAPSLCPLHRSQDFAQTNPVCPRMPFSNGPMSSSSVHYHVNIDVSGPFSAHESRQVLDLKPFEQQEKNLRMKIKGLEEELGTIKLWDALPTENDHYESRMYEADMYHLGSQVNRGDKRSYVHIWQPSDHIRPRRAKANHFEESTQNMKDSLLEESEETRLEAPELSRDNLKNWVETSLQKLIRSRFEASRQNVQKGLQALMSRLSNKGSEASKQNLQEWLQASIKDLQEVCPAKSRKDVKEWLEITKSYLQDRGPEAPRLSVQDWLKASMKSIQDLQEKSFEGSIHDMEDLPEEPEEIMFEVPEFPRENLKKSWVEASLQQLIRSRSEASRQNVQKGLQALMSRLSKKGSAASKQNLKEWLEVSIKDLQSVCPVECRKDMKEWLEISKSYLQKKGSETSKLSVQNWLKASMKSLQDLPDKSFERSVENVQEDQPEEPEEMTLEVPEFFRDNLKKSWVEASLQNLLRSRFEASRQNVQKGLQALMSRLSKKGSAASKQNLQEWLESSIKDLQSVCPAKSRKDMKEWLEISKSYLQDKGSEAPRISVQDWLKASMKSIQDLQGKSFEEPTQNMQDDLLEGSEEMMFDTPVLFRDHLKKAWLEQSLQKLIRSRSEASRQNLQEGLQALMSGLSKKGSTTSKQNLKEWLEASIRDLQSVCPAKSRKDMKEWLEISKSYLQDRGPEAPRISVQDWLKASMKSIQDLQEKSFEESIHDMHEDLPEEIMFEVPEFSRENLKKSWVEASLQKLIRSRSEASRQNVQKGLQALMSRLSKKDSAASKQNLQEWLESSIKDLQSVCPVESRKDMKEWLEITKSYLQDRGPETPRISVQDWLKASMKSIQDLRGKSFEESMHGMHEDLPEKPEEIMFEVPEFSTDNLKKSWVEASLQNLIRSRSEASRQNVQEGLQALMSRLSKKGSAASKQNLKDWLEASIRDLQEVCPAKSRKDMKEWLEISKSYLQDRGPEAPRLSVQDWLKASMKSIQDLQERSFERSIQNMQDDLTEEPEETSPDVPVLSKDHLNKGWLEASLESLRRSRSEASRRNMQKWLQTSMSRLRGAPEAVKDNLMEWIEASIKHLPEEFPESSRKDMKEWLELSKSYLQKRSPEISKLNVEDWLRKSLSGIQELRHPQVSKSTLQVQGPEDSIIDVRSSLERTSLVDQNVERSSRNVHEWYRSLLIDEKAATSEQDMGRRLQLSSGVDSCEDAPRSMHSGFGTSYGMARPGTPSHLTAERFVRSTTDFLSEGPGSSTLYGRGGLSESIPKVRQGTSRMRVQEWLEASMRNLEASGSQVSKLSLQQWLEESLRNLHKTCSSNSRHDVQEWLQESLRKVQESKASKPSVNDWVKASLMSLKGEAFEVVGYLEGHIKALLEEASRLSVQEWLEGSLIKLQEEDPESSRDDVKEWLQSSLSKFRGVSPETSGHYVKKWLESSLKDLQKPKQNLQEYMKESLMRLRTCSFAPSRSRHDVDQLKVSQGTLGSRESRGILKHGSSRTFFGRPDVSRTNLLSEGYDVDLDEDESDDNSQFFTSPGVHSKTQGQRRAKGKWLHDQSEPGIEMVIAKVSNAFFSYRKSFKILLLVIPMAVIALMFFHCIRCCLLSFRGLRPF